MAKGQPIRATSSHGDLTWRGLAAPAVVDTTLGLYLVSQVSPLGSAPIVDELARVDRATGDAVAQRRLSASFDSAIAASGSLWVTTNSQTSEVLWRLDPRTLAVRGHWQVGACKGFVGCVGGSMAVAGGGLWVAGGDRLLRLSLPAGQVVASIPLQRAESSDVASNATGKVLIVGEATSSGVGTIERRDPVTGAVLARTPSVIGVAAPRVGGVIDGQVWVSEATGTMGYVQRYTVTPLASAGPACSEGRSTSSCMEGTNGISARVADGLVWMAQPAGGTTRQACIDPISGRVLSTLPLSNNDQLLTIGIRHLYVLEPTAPTVTGQSVTQVPIPHACVTS
ncbi:MAG: NHL repeat-containing protein [Acidimicrobiales bacterium]